MRITRKKVETMRKTIAKAREHQALVRAWDSAVQQLGNEEGLVAIHVSDDTDSIRAEYRISKDRQKEGGESQGPK